MAPLNGFGKMGQVDEFRGHPHHMDLALKKTSHYII